MSTARTAGTDGEDSAPPIGTVAGTKEAGPKGDNEAAVKAQLNRPFGIAVDATGTVYFSDLGNHRIRKITTDGRISAVAGTGVAGNRAGGAGTALETQLYGPRGVAVDAAGAVYVADTENHRIRKITPDGRISIVAGDGAAAFFGDGRPAGTARLQRPHDVAVDAAGVLYIADFLNNRIRKVGADGVISTFAGGAAAASQKEGVPATSVQLNRPSAVALDRDGSLYIADSENHRVRKVTADGVITTVAGNGKAGSGGDGKPAVEAQLNQPMGLVVDGTGALYIADHKGHRVRRVTADGLIETVAGTGSGGFEGDGGTAAEALLNNPVGLAVDCVDALYIADHTNNRIRKVASPRMAGLPNSGEVVSWANARSGLRMGVLRESTKDGAEIHQSLPVPRAHQRWRLLVVGHQDGAVLYTIENVHSGKVLEVFDGHACDGAPLVQRALDAGEAAHQRWRLIPVGEGPAGSGPGGYEIANHASGLLLRVDGDARAVVRQRGAEGDHRRRQWRLLRA
ncbi:RICIN domain-containing protein [Streptomyces sp. NPDC058486]|uniref:NHL domain-containing protein n=1 Tax=unclassified Streptomyces TaxID=2593676 RepID=UPI00364BBB47